MHYPSDGLRMVRSQSTPQHVLCVRSTNSYAIVPSEAPAEINAPAPPKATGPPGTPGWLYSILFLARTGLGICSANALQKSELHRRSCGV